MVFPGCPSYQAFDVRRTVDAKPCQRYALKLNAVPVITCEWSGPCRAGLDVIGVAGCSCERIFISAVLEASHILLVKV